MILSMHSIIQRVVLGMILIFGQSTLSADLADYAVPIGYCLHTSEDGAMTIKIVKCVDEKPARCVGWATIKWQKQAGVVTKARIVHLEVVSREQGYGFGSKLFDLAVYTLVKTLGAEQVNWCAQPLDNSRTLQQLISFYEKRGGIKCDDVSLGSEMCLTGEKIAEILVSKIPHVDEAAAEFLEIRMKVEQRVTIESVDGKKQCVLRCTKNELGDWLLEHPYCYTAFGVAQYKVLKDCLPHLSATGIF